jgi:hypothetical protein
MMQMLFKESFCNGTSYFLLFFFCDHFIFENMVLNHEVIRSGLFLSDLK